MNDNLDSILKAIKAQLESGEIAEAVEAMTLLNEKHGLKFGDELALQGARFYQNERERSLTHIDDYRRFSAQINVALIGVLRDLTKKIKAGPTAATAPVQPPVRVQPVENQPVVGIPKLVVLYHIDDAAHALQLEKQLKLLTRANKLTVHFQHKPTLGLDVAAAATAAIAEARMVTILATQEFFFEDINLDLLDTAKNAGKPIVPILVKSFNLSGSGIEGLRALPSNNKFIYMDWPNADAAWLDISNGLRAVLIK